MIVAVLVAAGALLRLALMLAYRPGFLGVLDSGLYIGSAKHGLFSDRWHPVGYALFLRAVHAVDGALPVAIVVQHLLAILAAMLIYLAVRRLGGPGWLALVPAAVVLLGGDQAFFEHAVMSEALYTPLLAALLFASIRCIDDPRLRWPVTAGVLVGLTVTVRVSALALLPVLALWSACSLRCGAGQRVLRAAAIAGAGAVLVFGYAGAVSTQIGHWTLTPNSAFNFYGRVATFADCRQFRPPAGTAWLCDRTPLATRRFARYYLFIWGPLVERYATHFRAAHPGQLVSWMLFHAGSSHLGSRGSGPRHAQPVQHIPADLSAFSRAAVLAQPLDWLRVSLEDFTSYVEPPRNAPGSPDSVETAITAPLAISTARQVAAGYYSDTSVVEHPRRLRALRDYERWTRLEGLPLTLILVLAAAAPFACRGRRMRLGSSLFALVAYTTMAVPVFALEYDVRYGVPAYGPLTAAAAMGCFGLYERAVAHRRVQANTSGSRR